jgi:hypothetical protein
MYDYVAFLSFFILFFFGYYLKGLRRFFTSRSGYCNHIVEYFFLLKRFYNIIPLFFFLASCSMFFQRPPGELFPFDKNPIRFNFIGQSFFLKLKNCPTKQAEVTVGSYQ